MKFRNGKFKLLHKMWRTVLLFPLRWENTHIYWVGLQNISFCETDDSTESVIVVWLQQTYRNKTWLKIHVVLFFYNFIIIELVTPNIWTALYYFIMPFPSLRDWNLYQQDVRKLLYHFILKYVWMHFFKYDL